MSQLFLIAFRNLAQNGKRTWILGGAIAGVTTLLVFLLCLTSGVHHTMIESATTLSTGHINVAGFYKVTAGQSAPVITGFNKLEEIVRKTIPDEIDYIASRGRGWAKIVADEGSMQVAIGGLDIKNEPGFRRVVQVAQGKLDDLVEPGTILIFEEQAKKLGVKVGDTMVLSALTPRGINNTVDVRVVAVARDVGMLSSWNVYCPEQTVRQLAQLNNDTTGALHVYLKDMKRIPNALDLLRNAFSAAGYTLMDREAKPFWEKFQSVNREDWTGQKLDLTTWEEEMSFFNWTIAAVDGLMFILITVLLIIISVGIMNSMWIAIRERTREIGTLRAIGMQRPRVLAMFLIEAFSLGLLGSTGGALIGVLVSVTLNIVRIPIPEAVRMFLLSNTLGFSFEPLRILGGMLVIVGCTTLIALIPATHAARLKPITAMQHIGLWLAVAFGLSLANPLPTLAAEALPKEKMVELLKGIDQRIKSPGDYKALVYLEQREKDKTDVVREALAYRRDADEKLMILFTKPRTEAGKGYLRVERNLWYYDPTVGKWERRTDRERIAGTDSRRQDWDQSKLAEEYDPTFEAEEKLGNFKVWVLKLVARPKIDVAYPVVKLWIDQATGNDLKRQDFALSGKLMRTSYVPKWQKLYSASKKAELWYRQEIRIFDEIDKANSTLVIIKSVDLQPLPENIFTKAWLESKSR